MSCNKYLELYFYNLNKNFINLNENNNIKELCIKTIEDFNKINNINSPVELPEELVEFYKRVLFGNKERKEARRILIYLYKFITNDLYNRNIIFNIARDDFNNNIGKDDAFIIIVNYITHLIFGEDIYNIFNILN